MNIEAYNKLAEECKRQNVTLVAVSKTKPVEDILALYNLGHRDFGENYVQELVEKEKQLPKDIRWHFIGHLQTNKVKQIIGLIHIIQTVDSFKLLKEIDKQSAKMNKVTNCLLQIRIAQEETKFGLEAGELTTIMENLSTLKNVNICGYMGMASLTDDEKEIRLEFSFLSALKKLVSRGASNLPTAETNYKIEILSMGMTSDYKIAIEEGSNMIRVGSLIFGERKAL